MTDNSLKKFTKSQKEMLTYLRLGGLYCLRASMRSLALVVSVVLADLMLFCMAFSLHHSTWRSNALGLKLRSQWGHRLEATSFMRLASERSEERLRSRLTVDGAAAAAVGSSGAHSTA